jgi:Rod binding domain-containing protein
MEIGNGDSGIGNRVPLLTAPANPTSRRPIADSRLDAAAKDFEAVFIAQMLAPLFSSVETPSIAGGGKSEDFFKSLMQDAYAKAMAERGGFGLADHVKSSLITLQGGAGTAPARSTP